MDVEFTEKEKAALSGALKLGNTREVAASVVGLTSEELLAEVEKDPSLARKIMRSEAAAEVHHMNTIHQAAKDEKNWRTAAWWIDRRDRQRSADAKWALSDVTAAIGAAIRRLLEIILAEVPDPRRRHSIVAKLLDVSGNGAEDPTQEDAKAVSAAVSVALERAAGSSVGEEQCHD